MFTRSYRSFMLLSLMMLLLVGCNRATETTVSQIATASPPVTPTAIALSSPLILLPTVSQADLAWPSYTSKQGGYTLRYPPGWTATAGQKGAVVLTPPTGAILDKITASYMDFEKPEAQELTTWAEAFFALGLGPDLQRTFRRVFLDVYDPDHNSQQIHIEYMPPVPGGIYLVMRGRLILGIHTDSNAEGFAESLQLVANSIVFLADGPIDQRQLSYPEDPPFYTTIEAYQQRIDDSLLASEAINYRLQTGKEADHLLAVMSDRARQEYDRMFADATDYIATIDRQREAQISPLPSPTPPVVQ